MTTPDSPRPIPQVSPQDAWAMMADDPSAVLVDVRTVAEWNFVGLPDLAGLGREVVTIEWNRLDGTHNDAFTDQLAAAGVPTDAPVLFLCRSGARSDAAASAAASEGWAAPHNIVGGFEGDKDEAGHRGTVNGWKVAGLPWRQG